MTDLEQWKAWLNKWRIDYYLCHCDNKKELVIESEDGYSMDFIRTYIKFDAKDRFVEITAAEEFEPLCR